VFRVDKYVIVLAAFWILVTTMGAYLVFYKKPAELEVLQQNEQVARLKQAEVETLLVEEAASAQAAEEVLRKWNTRYKLIPSVLTSPDVVGYLNGLTLNGFKNFDIRLGGRKVGKDYSVYTYEVSGRGYFGSLYRFIWRAENDRNLYRVRDLQLDQIDLVSVDRRTGRDRMDIMVSFNFVIDAYFGMHEGISVTEEQVSRLLAEHGIDAPARPSAPPVPRNVLPSETPAINPFFPLLMPELPPNTHNYIDIEMARLVSIADGKAFFQDAEGFRSVGLGDPVYLGKIIALDSATSTVTARLNKGGIIDDVTLSLQTGDRLIRNGGIILAPIDTEMEENL
jgi:hypothetical protein